MAPERLSGLQRRILVWLLAEDQRTRGTMRASHQDLVQALVARGHDKGNVSTSLTGLEVKGLVTITRTPGGKAEAVDLTVEGRARAEVLNNGLNKGTSLQRVWIDFPVEEFEALEEYAGRELRTPEMQIRLLVRQYLEARGWRLRKPPP
jgi:DNA-binding MarR family transcriptional regulator